MSLPFPLLAGTDRTPPVNPIFEYAVDVLGLRLQPKHRDGPGATALYDRRAPLMFGAAPFRASDRD